MSMYDSKPIDKTGQPVEEVLDWAIEPTTAEADDPAYARGSRPAPTNQGRPPVIVSSRALAATAVVEALVIALLLIFGFPGLV